MRMEQDNLGTVKLSDTVMYGINTQRAVENFPLQHKRVSLRLIHDLVLVKKAAALTYEDLGVREKGIYATIAQACDEILTGSYDAAFPTETLQGGAGTSTNLNVDEVVANVALNFLGQPAGSYAVIHPVDDVNRGQSTNDSVPTALHITLIKMLQELIRGCTDLQTALKEKATAYAHIQKLGRTELEDAVPMTLGREFGAYAHALYRDCVRLTRMQEDLLSVNQGGTAIGMCNTATPAYREKVYTHLQQVTGLPLRPAVDLVDATQNNDVLVEVSGALKTLAVDLMKMANDLRLMNAGPDGALGEIHLQPLQQGSSIMPGKVNPVIPEMMVQCSMRVMANDVAVTMAAAHGEFELNAFFPLMADGLLESLDILTRAVAIFRTKAVEVLTADEGNCLKHLTASAAFGTAYTGRLGYDTVSHILKTHTPVEAKKILDAMLVKKAATVTVAAKTKLTAKSKLAAEA